MRHGYAIDTTFRAVDRMSGPLSRMEASVGRLGRKVDLSFAGISQATMGLSRRAAWAGAAMTAWPIAAALATGEMTDSLNSLRQVGVRDVGAMRQAAIDFSNQWSGVTAPEFVAAAYDIRSAINLTDKTLVHFTRVNALTAKATKASTEEMRGAFTVGWGALRATMPKATDIAFLDRYAAAMVKTTGIFRATGGSMAAAISNLGAEATNLGFSLETQLAILGRLQTTMSGEEAGTMFRSFLTQAQRNLGKLGPVFYKAFQQKDLVGMLDALNKRFGDMSDPRNSARLFKALGEVRAKQFVGLLRDTRAIRGEIQGIGLDARRGLPYVDKMAGLVNEGVGAGAARARQQVQNLGLLIGDVTAPAVERLAAKASKWILAAQKWVKENRPLIRQLSDMSLKWGPWIVGIAGVTGGLTMAAGAVVKVVNTWKAFRAVMVGVKVATEGAVVAQKALNAAQALDLARRGYQPAAPTTVPVGRGVARVLPAATVAAPLAAAGAAVSVGIGVMEIKRQIRVANEAENARLQKLSDRRRKEEAKAAPRTGLVPVGPGFRERFERGRRARMEDTTGLRAPGAPAAPAVPVVVVKTTTPGAGDAQQVEITLKNNTGMDAEVTRNTPGPAKVKPIRSGAYGGSK